MAQVKYNQAFIRDVNRYVAENNPSGTIKVLQDNGYTINTNAPLEDILAVLMAAYIEDKVKWGNILKAVPRNTAAANWTTDPAVNAGFRQQLAAATGDAGINLKTGVDWLDAGIDLVFGGSDTTTTGGTSSTVDTTGRLKTLAWFGSIAAVVLAALTYLIFFHKKEPSEQKKGWIFGIWIVLLSVFGYSLYQTSKTAGVTTSTTGATTTGQSSGGVLGPILSLFGL